MINKCQYDGVDFKTSHARAKFCSQKCANLAKTKSRLQLKCDYCGTQFTQKVPLRIDKYCSKECDIKDKAKQSTRCLQCNKEFIGAHKTTKYCSNECAWKSKEKPKISGICENCHEPFTTKYTTTNWIYNNKIAKRKFCSKRCQLESMHKDKVKCNCLVCGNEFVVFPSDIKNGRGKFCSHECRGLYWSAEKHHNWNNGSTIEKEKLRKSPAYKAWRIAVFLRDNKTCVQCGVHYRHGYTEIEADHIRPRSLFPELTLDINNGRTLCRKCHKKTITYGASLPFGTIKEDFLTGGKLYPYVETALKQIGVKDYLA